jgi:hypothetical protein
MNASRVQVLMYFVVAIVIGLYVLFVVWRLRVDRRKKAAGAPKSTLPDSTLADREARVLGTAARLSPETPVTPMVTPPTPAPEGPAPPRPSGPMVSTVAELLAGIRLPNDLAPVVDMAPRTGVLDRVAFATSSAPAETLGPAFTAELERLGFTVTPTAYDTLEIERGADLARVVIHPVGHRAAVEGQIGFPYVREGSVVVEVWIPALRGGGTTP